MYHRKQRIALLLVVPWPSLLPFAYLRDVAYPARLFVYIRLHSSCTFTLSALQKDCYPSSAPISLSFFVPTISFPPHAVVANLVCLSWLWVRKICVTEMTGFFLRETGPRLTFPREFLNMLQWFTMVIVRGVILQFSHTIIPEP